MRKWDSNSRVDYTKLLEFVSPGFAYIYREDTARGKKLLPRSVFGHFVGMASDKVLIKVFIPQTKAILYVRKSDFHLQDKSEALLDGIAKQLAEEQE